MNHQTKIGGVTSETLARKASEVEQAQKRLESALAGLGSAISTLSGRLVPVRMMMDCSVGDELARQSSFTSPVAAQIVAAADNADGMARGVLQLIDELAV